MVRVQIVVAGGGYGRQMLESAVVCRASRRLTAGGGVGVTAPLMGMAKATSSAAKYNRLAMLRIWSTFFALSRRPVGGPKIDGSGGNG